MRAFSKCLIAIILLSTLAAYAKIQFDEEPRPTSTFRAASARELRKVRRVGMGFSAAGALGIGGINLELNFNYDSGFMIGFGGATPGVQTFSFEYKGVLAGESLLPYFTVGFAHWRTFSSTGPFSQSSPAFLAEKLLTQKEKDSGQIQKTLFYPGFGLQFVQLGGALAGHSVYIEGQLLIDFTQFILVPTGTLGYLYYF